jgi:rod shape determining protein RodA
VLLKGSGTGFARRWLQIGPIGFQPSEFAKLAVIMALARYLSGRRSKWSARHLLVPMFMVLIPTVLVIREPDLGTSLVFIAVLFPMLYWSGMRFPNLLLILSPAVNVFCVIIWAVSGEYIPWAAFIVSFTLLAIFSRLRLSNVIILILINVIVGVGASYSWDRLRMYQQKRIMTFFNPGLDPEGTGYQIIQSKIAIGSGGALGKGFLKGTQSRLDFLPAQHTDFIFSVLGEELGFIGCLSVIGLFSFIIWRGVRIASTVQSRFSSLMAIGLVSVILFHVFVNVGVTVGIMPVTGIPLPFISYGGSFMVLNMLSMGLLLNISAHRHEYY